MGISVCRSVGTVVLVDLGGYSCRPTPRANCLVPSMEVVAVGLIEGVVGICMARPREGYHLCLVARLTVLSRGTASERMAVDMLCLDWM